MKKHLNKKQTTYCPAYIEGSNLIYYKDKQGERIRFRRKPAVEKFLANQKDNRKKAFFKYEHIAQLYY